MLNQVKDEAVRGWDHAYNISEDCIHSTTEGELGWCSSSSASLDSYDALENWQSQMHEVSIWKCGLVTQSLCRAATEIFELPLYKGLLELSEFLVEFEDKVSKPQQLLALDEALKATLARWWATYKKSITGWFQC